MSADRAVGRIAAEIVTPYPPGVPVIVPGDRITAEAVDYLRSGVAAGMQLPDPTDPQLEKIKVVAKACRQGVTEGDTPSTLGEGQKGPGAASSRA